MSVKKWFERAPPFFRVLLLVLGGTLLLSFLGDEMFLTTMASTGEATSSISKQQQQQQQPQKQSNLPANTTTEETAKNDSATSSQITIIPDDEFRIPDKPLHKRIWNSLTSTRNNSTLSPRNPRISIVVDRLEPESSTVEEDLAQITFARMISLEAEHEYGIATQIVVVVNDTSKASELFSCFPQVSKYIRIVNDGAHWMHQRMEQEQWLGENALDATQNGWNETLSLLSRKQFSLNARYADDISLPYVRIHETSIPNIMEYSHVDEILKMVQNLKSDCCTVTTKVDDETAVYLDQESPLQPRQLLTLLQRHRTNGSHIVLLGDQEANFADHFVPLLKRQGGFLVHSGVATSLKSMTPYCLLSKASYEVMGSVTSPLSSWAVLTNTKAPLRRLVVPKDLPKEFPSNDPRSSIVFEAIPEDIPLAPSPTTVAVKELVKPVPKPSNTTNTVSNSNSMNELDLIVELPTYNPLFTIAESLALQFQLSKVLGVPTNLVWRHGPDRWLRHVSRVQKCYPYFSKQDFEAGNSELWDVLMQKASNLMVIESNNATNMTTVMSQLVQVARRWNDFRQTSGSNDANSINTSTPFLLLRDGGVKVQMTDDFRSDFDRIFRFNEQDSDCRDLVATGSIESAPTMWAHVTGTQGSNIDVTEDYKKKTNISTILGIPGESEGRWQTPGKPGHEDRPITIVIEMSGEMGNQIAKLAHGYGLKWLLKEDYNITSRPILQHQTNHKWVHARESVVKCFPNFEYADFSEGNTDEFKLRSHELFHWLGKERKEQLYINCPAESCVREKLAVLVDGVLSNSTLAPANETSDANITLPFLVANNLAMHDFLIDRYYERFRDLFRFNVNSSSCCSLRAKPDETALHIREFLTEMPKRGVKYGFTELSANKTASDLLGHLSSGDNVAVVSRFPTKMAQYFDAIGSRGLNVRNADEGNGEFSFCFLMSAQKEMIGNAQSTFAIWAALLGNSSKAKLYSVNDPNRANRFTREGLFFHYNYTNPALRSRIRFELYSTEEQDEIDNNNTRMSSRY